MKEKLVIAAIVLVMLAIVGGLFSRILECQSKGGEFVYNTCFSKGALLK